MNFAFAGRLFRPLRGPWTTLRQMSGKATPRPPSTKPSSSQYSGRSIAPPSPHFSWEELERSDTAARGGLSNAVPDIWRPNVVALCENVLEPIRRKYMRPVIVTSGYRSPPVNQAVGGAPGSQHTVGEAADIVVSGVSPEALQQWIVANLTFDQCIIYRDTSHVHVSFKRSGINRGEAFKL